MDDLRKVLVGLIVESSVETTKNLHELIKSYEEKGETVIPIEKLKECISNGLETSMKKDSLTSSLIKD